MHLGERDCSLQRRHQKVFEEAPGPAITPKLRARDRQGLRRRRWRSSTISARAPIEFLYEDGEFYFIEMNTRLQVEHPVTEAIFGVDLVREQIRVAAGMDHVVHAGRAGDQRPLPSRCGSTPRRSAELRALPRPGQGCSMRRAAWACGWIRRSMAATRSRPITTA